MLLKQFLVNNSNSQGVNIPEDVLKESSDPEENLGDTDCGGSLQQESSPGKKDINMSHQLTADEHLQELLRNLGDYSLETATDQALGKLNWQDFPALRRARAQLTVMGKDKKLDIFFRAQITVMVGTLNLNLDPILSFSWREASVLASKAAGHGVYHAHSLQS